MPVRALTTRMGERRLVGQIGQGRHATEFARLPTVLQTTCRQPSGCGGLSLARCCRRRWTELIRLIRGGNTARPGRDPDP